VTLQQMAEQALGHPVSSIIAFRDPAHTWEFMAYKDNDTALTIFGPFAQYAVWTAHRRLEYRALRGPAGHGAGVFLAAEDAGAAGDEV
jgi:hypothetical protein